ncbi:DUF2284 domain-containing protein [Thermococcus sibiricus]|uniref:Metal-binding protein n=1 Tax=Thermococcus sibiricus (strain DSM 12597 / MM 739) TaxID=604354 RepID=C6A063_THESM|nr:DUF2284 domain-containing protein [Thermococcus sibiricus]ACS91044.1 hypothetical protein TSIB_1997 [Thermococcus sibiricus MM 739]
MKIVWEKEILAKDIKISPRPIWKCRSCPAYAKNPSCPPYTPSWKETKELMKHYEKTLLIKFEVDPEKFDDEKREVLTYLLNREQELFKNGNFYALAFFPGDCNYCKECEFKKTKKCKIPTKVRFSIDGVGIELSSIVNLNFSESVLYGLILID